MNYTYNCCYKKNACPTELGGHNAGPNPFSLPIRIFTIMRVFFITCLLILSNVASAQQVPKTVLAEHFTNTYCSVCASRNPGLLSNLANYPQVLHVSYHPSAPYAACPLNVYNKPENDARTNYYSAYGGTPVLFVNGTWITSVYTDASIFSSQLGKTTSFDVKVSMLPYGADSAIVKVVVKKVDTSSLSALQLYGGIAEDTLFFTANNGEPIHTDVFRRSLWGTTSLAVTAPVAVGDSSVYIKVVAGDPVWVKSRIYAFAILQQGNKEVVQSARSAKALTAGFPTVAICPAADVCIYPNPALQMLFMSGDVVGSTVSILDGTGRLYRSVTITKNEQFIDISSLRTGLYYFVLNNSRGVTYKKFIKQ
ncbi:MAG: Secretion system C-terminal sorting domain [Flavipsychrobacter sp.]|jgi:hypothetical protein|nr:Secretion system C-terminal sorting domain [Flavipsychrobacter sp.]